ncbi:hypothetical protein IWX58_003269 [Rubrivivax gelatinosus]|uniref:hypothetical protein n=2 Tax=Rubrivivax gelatinosus TaxID=28068 RepID=UPI0005C21BBB|nr:hypothetical protein [Rubrivivax gelatinosus]MBG6081582.1 hypothetical protein [Rubrivivax gelatinosus]
MPKRTAATALAIVVAGTLALVAGRAAQEPAIESERAAAPWPMAEPVSAPAEPVVAPSPSGPPRSAAPPQRWVWRLNTASPEDLYAIYRAGLESDSVEAKFIASEAVGHCLLSVHDVHAGLAMADAQIKGDIELARTQLRDRCKLFYGESPQALRAGRKALHDAVYGPDSPISSVALDLPDDPGAAQVRQVRAALSRTLLRDGGDALLWAGGALSSWLQFLQQHPDQAAGLDETLREGATLGEAVLLASCTLGGHCGRGTLLQLMFCMQMGRCDAVDATVVAGAEDAPAAERMQAQAAVIAEAIRTGRLSRLGLPTAQPPGLWGP